MKKIFTLLLSVTFSTLGFSQGFTIYDASFNVLSNTTMNINISPSTITNTTLSIRNNGAATKSVKVLRTVYSIAGTDVTNFSWSATTESSSTNLSSFSQDITAGQTLTYALGGFQATLNAGTSTSVRQVHYRFYDVANPSDSVGVTLKYMTSVGIDEQTFNRVTLNSFPNPVTDLLNINYAIENNFKVAKLIVYDMLGKKIKEYSINDKHGVLKIATDDLSEGLYFYTFVVDDALLATRKIIVNKK